MIKNSVSFIAVSVLLMFTMQLNAQNWPGWRGGNSDGTSNEKNLPIEWTPNSFKWKTAVPGEGYASPVIWGKHIFLVSALVEEQERVLLCYDKTNGKLLWQKTVIKAVLERKHPDNGYASSTPVTDGKKVFVTFQDGDEVAVAAYDFNGNQLWLSKPGKFASPHGFCSSPVLYKDKVIVNAGNHDDSFVAALNIKDGSLAYKIDQPAKQLSYMVPIIKNMAGKAQMIVGTGKRVISYNPENGTEFWTVDGPSDEFASTPVYDSKTGFLIICSSYPRRQLLAIRPDGSGNVSETHVVWKQAQGAPYTPSPTLAGEYLFCTHTSGNLYCYKVSTGEVLWSEKTGAQYSSPVFAGGLLYLLNDAGEVHVIKPGLTYERIALNHINEKGYPSPAISESKMYYRGDKHLMCIGM